MARNVLVNILAKLAFDLQRLKPQKEWRACRGGERRRGVQGKKTRWRSSAARLAGGGLHCGGVPQAVESNAMRERHGCASASTGVDGNWQSLDGHRLATVRGSPISHGSYRMVQRATRRLREDRTGRASQPPIVPGFQGQPDTFAARNAK